MGELSIKMPDVGEGVAEAELVEWHVKEGDLVREDDVLDLRSEEDDEDVTSARVAAAGRETAGVEGELAVTRVDVEGVGSAGAWRDRKNWLAPARMSSTMPPVACSGRSRARTSRNQWPWCCSNAGAARY